MRLPIYRSTQIGLLVLFALFLAALGVLGALDWRDWQRLNSIRVQMEHTQAIQHIALSLQRKLLDDVAGRPEGATPDLRPVRKDLATLLARGASLDAGTSRKLEDALDLLANPDHQPRAALADALGMTSDALADEARPESALLDALTGDARVELQLATSVLIGFPIVVVLTVWTFRQRIFRPITNLQALLLRLANGEFTPIDVHGVDPILAPLFSNYNQMVQRLQRLEEAHQRNAVTLENEVRTATGALLVQQQSLARAERLAAVGELGASVAHELRNPLAGIQMALANLRRDISDATLVQRLDLVVAEIQRITRLLNDMLAQAQHSPEPAREVNLAEVVKELLALTRFQTPPKVHLVCNVPEPLHCRVPADRLRQALLNLVLNAVHALDDVGGKVTIAAREDGNFVKVTVCDNGPGFDGALLAGGIRPFVTSREDGTGLGLAIAKRFTQDVGGELYIANLTPHGACVTLSLPVTGPDG